MEVTIIWSGLLTFALSIIGWLIKSTLAEINRLNILLNRTREEVAKEYVTKTEVHADINRVMNRLEALDSKLDRLLESRATKAG